MSQQYREDSLPPGLSAFQSKCFRLVEDLLLRHGHDISHDIGGERETYLVLPANLDSVTVRIYVYEDEAGYFLDDDWRIWERPDYDSDDELIRAFLADLERVISQAGSREP